MRTELLFQEMQNVLSLFAAEHLNYPVFFSQLMSNINPQGVSHDKLTMTSSTGISLLSFIITRNRQVYNQAFQGIVVKLYDPKHLDIYNLFINKCCKNSSDSFSLYMESVRQKTKKLNLINSIEILPWENRKLIDDDKFIKIDSCVHAIMTTPFETINIRKMPRFFFENNRFYLHDHFSFSSMGTPYTFCQQTEKDIDYILDVVDEFSEHFYETHYETITGKIHELYDIPISEFGRWKTKQFQEYYPILSMERY